MRKIIVQGLEQFSWLVFINFPLLRELRQFSLTRRNDVHRIFYAYPNVQNYEVSTPPPESRQIFDNLSLSKLDFPASQRKFPSFSTTLALFKSRRRTSENFLLARCHGSQRPTNFPPSSRESPPFFTHSPFPPPVSRESNPTAKSAPSYLHSSSLDSQRSIDFHRSAL